MVIVPQTNIILLKTPLELSDNNQLTWSTLNEQYTYFSSLPKLILDDATYQRKEGVIRFPTNSTTTYEDLLQYNYCMYQNEAYDNKWFYAYITEINYVNDGMSTIKLETDVWNTWWNDLTFYKSFVEREHVNDDTIGLHTIPEGLETGEYVVNESHTNYNLQAKANILAVTKDYYFDSQGNFVMGGDNGGGIYGGVRSAYKYYLFNNTSTSKLQATIEGYAQAGESDAIGMIFTVPFWTIPRHTTDTDDVAVEETLTPNTLYWNSDEIHDPRITKPTNINGYTPKNNKLFTFPYCYFIMSNNNGGNAIYHYELFNSNYLDFTIKSVCTPSMSGIIIPQLYNGEAENYNEALQMAKFPICGFQSDVYTNWLTQSSLNRSVNIIKGASVGGISGAIAGFKMGANPYTALGGAIVGTFSSLLNSVTNSVVEMKEHEFIPPQAEGNTNTGDISYADGKCSFTYYKMSIKEEYAQIIDNYFTMYGYKVNALKVPNIRGRLNWNYVKTIGCNVTGDIPQLDLEKIKELFDKGITLWHHTNTFLDYSQSNTIIS